jgi:hypothetical protein
MEVLDVEGGTDPPSTSSDSSAIMALDSPNSCVFIAYRVIGGADDCPSDERLDVRGFVCCCSACDIEPVLALKGKFP